MRRQKVKTDWRSVYVMCPFYKGNDAMKLRCESFLDGATNAINFQSAEGLNFHMTEYCSKHFRCCELYRAIREAKYGDD